MIPKWHSAKMTKKWYDEEMALWRNGTMERHYKGRNDTMEQRHYEWSNDTTKKWREDMMKCGSHVETCVQPTPPQKLRIIHVICSFATPPIVVFLILTFAPNVLHTPTSASSPKIHPPPPSTHPHSFFSKIELQRIQFRALLRPFRIQGWHIIPVRDLRRSERLKMALAIMLEVVL